MKLDRRMKKYRKDYRYYFRKYRETEDYLHTLREYRKTHKGYQRIHNMYNYENKRGWME